MTIQDANRAATVVLRIGFFALMCIGLLLASVFLWLGKIDGGHWVTVCLSLFGADRLSNAVTEGVSAARAGTQS